MTFWGQLEISLHKTRILLGVAKAPLTIVMLGSDCHVLYAVEFHAPKCNMTMANQCIGVSKQGDIISLYRAELLISITFPRLMSVHN